MTISGDNSTAANAAITALNAALTAHAAQAGPQAKDVYEGTTIFPLVTTSAALAASLGRTLYDEQIAAAKAALAPFVAGTVERDRLTYELSVPKQLLAWISSIATDAASPCRAVNNARLIVSTFTRVLAAVA